MRPRQGRESGRLPSLTHERGLQPHGPGPLSHEASDLLDDGSPTLGEGVELRAALIDATNLAIGSGDLDGAEVILDHAYTMEGGTDDLDPLRSALENAYMDSQSQRVVQVGDLTRINTEPPKYPSLALKREVSGWVEITFTVTPQGNTADIEVDSFEPSAIFNRAAVRAVEKWQFEPVQFRGQVVSQRVVTRLAFELD